MKEHQLQLTLLRHAGFWTTLASYVGLICVGTALFSATKMAYSPQDGVGELLFPAMSDNACCLFTIVQSAGVATGLLLLKRNQAVGLGLLLGIPSALIVMALFGEELVRVAVQIVPLWS